VFEEERPNIGESLGVGPLDPECVRLIEPLE